RTREAAPHRLRARGHRRGTALRERAVQRRAAGGSPGPASPHEPAPRARRGAAVNAPAPVEAFIRRVLGSLNDGSFVRLVLSSPGRAESSPDTPGHDRSRASGTDAGPRIERVLGRLIELR